MGGLAFLQNLIAPATQPPQPMGAAPAPVALPPSPEQAAVLPSAAVPTDPGLSTILGLNQQPVAKPTVQGPTKLHKLLGILAQGAIGAAAGAGQRTFGQGFQQAQNVEFAAKQQQAQLAQEEAARQATQAEAAQRQAQVKLLQTNVPVTLPNGQQVMIPQSALGGYLGKVVPKQIEGQTQENVANINKRFVAVPNIGLYDTQSRSVIPATAEGISITPEIAKAYNLPDQFIGKPLPLNSLSALQNAQRFNEQPVEGEAGPSLVNRNPASPDFGKVTPLGLGNPSMGRPVQVGDVNNPGQTTYMSAGKAIQSGAPGTQSASVQVPKAAAKSEVPTQIGNTKVAFATAMQHADLLQQALSAMNNPNDPSNVRTLNSLKNKFKTEFGSPDVTNFQAIANAYSREIAAVLAKGHMTDAEITSAGATLPANASPQQILGAVENYRRLVQSKLNVLNQQKQNAIQQSQPQKTKQTKNDPLSIR